MPGFPLIALAVAAAAIAQEHHHPPASTTPASGYADMGPHMRVTVKPPMREGDRDRAFRILDQTRGLIARYKDHRRAVEDGFQPFLAHLPLPEYHFTNYWYGFKANFAFDVEQPTSLLYVKEDGGYRLTGVMFTAPAGASLEELDRRLPLSVAQWHLHTSVCLPPKGRGGEMLRKNARFGFEGSIHTREACDAAGGRFFPRLFGWMVHVYPYEERFEDAFRMPGHHDHGEEKPGPEPEKPAHAHGGTHPH